MRLLLHCCCGPCTTGVADYWCDRGAAVRGWFFNPNIWPDEERRRRRETFAQAAEAMDVPTAPAAVEPPWREFLLALARGRGPRCHACYRVRLEAAARQAEEEGCDAFSTTLAVSPYQDQEALRRIGEEVAARHRVRFEFADLRDRFAMSRERAKALGLYRQNYCGCLFSRLERAERRAVRRVEEAKSRNGRESGIGRNGHGRAAETADE